MPAILHSIFHKNLAQLTCAVFVLAAIGCAGPDASVRSPVDSARAPSVEREDLTFPIDKGIRAVEIDSRLGEISVRNREQNEVAIHGVIQLLPPDFGRARIVSSRVGDVLRFAVELPEGTQGGRYDMAVYVPSGMPLILHGAVDRVDARKRAAPLTVTTTSGNINASSQGRMNVTTDSGSVKAIVRAENWVGQSRIRSGSGRILLLAPLSGDISLNAETGGRLSNDFGLSVHPRAGGGSTASARYGAGTSDLFISSDSGEVVLEQAILLEQDSE